MSNGRNRVCPVELADSLDSKIRKWLQNPQKILAPYVKDGMEVLDIGCGPGVFSVEMAKLVGEKGKVLAADLQEGMLEKLKNKIAGTELEKIINIIKCEQDAINVSEKVDFILAFYVIHEVPDKNSFFGQLRNILNEEGQLLVVEPKLFHVSKKQFGLTLGIAEANGFIIHQGPKLPFSWSAVLGII